MKKRQWYGILMMLPLVLVGAARVFFAVEFMQQCSGHMELAAQANTIALAKRELGQAVRYLKHHQMTSGYTSIVWDTPDENVEFFYSNLEASLQELEDLSKKNITPLEASNCLLKLRDTLTDQGMVTHPMGLSVYPNNGAMAFWRTLTSILAFVGFLLAAPQIYD